MGYITDNEIQVCPGPLIKKNVELRKTSHFFRDGPSKNMTMGRRRPWRRNEEKHNQNCSSSGCFIQPIKLRVSHGLTNLYIDLQNHLAVLQSLQSILATSPFCRSFKVRTFSRLVDPKTLSWCFQKSLAFFFGSLEIDLYRLVQLCITYIDWL